MIMYVLQAFGDMYLTLGRAEKKVALTRRQSEVTKAATVKAQAAL